MKKDYDKKIYWQVLNITTALVTKQGDIQHFILWRLDEWQHFSFSFLFGLPGK